MKRFLLSLLALLALQAQAGDLMMSRSRQDFEEAMSTLQNAIAEHGYKVARVQRVDVGLTAKGYATDKYRVVFFGKAEEVARLSKKYPELVPYLPLSVAIFAEQNDTLIAAARPGLLAQFYSEPELQPVFERWEKDLLEIFDEVREAR